MTIFQNGPFSKNEFSKHFLAKKLKFGQNTSQYAYFQILEKNCTIKKNKTIFGVKGIFNSFTQKWSPFFQKWNFLPKYKYIYIEMDFDQIWGFLLKKWGHKNVLKINY